MEKKDKAKFKHLTVPTMEVKLSDITPLPMIVKFKHLSIPIKTAVIGSWIIIGVWTVALVTAFVTGIVARA